MEKRKVFLNSAEDEIAKDTFGEVRTFWRKDQAKTSNLHTAAVGGAIRVIDLLAVSKGPNRRKGRWLRGRL